MAAQASSSSIAVAIVLLSLVEWSLCVEYAIVVKDGESAADVAASLGLVLVKEISFVPGAFLFEGPDVSVAERSLEEQRLVDHPSVHRVTRQIRTPKYPRSLPTDPLFSSQWHLDATIVSSPHPSLSVLGSWENSPVKGGGVTVCVVDDGLQYNGNDLTAAFLSDGSWDIVDGDSDVTPTARNHGTQCGAVAVAREDTMCGVGVAPQANITAIRYLGRDTTDVETGTALTYRHDINHIYSCSWGPTDDGSTVEGPGEYSIMALKAGVTMGRNGKGSIFVWAAGNGGLVDDCNMDGYVNSPYTIAVTSIAFSSRPSSHSEPCAANLVAAPSSGTQGRGIVTTATSTGCTTAFSGTSASAPMVSGIVALMLSANPGLGWRDVQEILVGTANSGMEATGITWFVNGAGRKVSDALGFGVADASRAVDAALRYSFLLPPRSNLSLPFAVEDAPKGSLGNLMEVDLSVSAEMRLEVVQVYVSMSHPARGQVAVYLRSPSGTLSQLLHTRDRDDNADIDWTFTTVQFWGEGSSGSFVLYVADEVGPLSGSISAATLILLGVDCSEFRGEHHEVELWGLSHACVGIRDGANVSQTVLSTVGASQPPPPSLSSTSSSSSSSSSSVSTPQHWSVSESHTAANGADGDNDANESESFRERAAVPFTLTLVVLFIVCCAYRIRSIILTHHVHQLNQHAETAPHEEVHPPEVVEVVTRRPIGHNSLAPPPTTTTLTVASSAPPSAGAASSSRGPSGSRGSGVSAPVELTESDLAAAAARSSGKHGRTHHHHGNHHHGEGKGKREVSDPFSDSEGSSSFSLDSDLAHEIEQVPPATAGAAWDGVSPPSSPHARPQGSDAAGPNKTPVHHHHHHDHVADHVEQTPVQEVSLSFDYSD